MTHTGDPYPTQIEDRSILINELTWLDQAAMQRREVNWVAASDSLRHAIIAELAAATQRPRADANGHFFRRVRRLIVGAYFTTETGMASLGYVGNVALESFPPLNDTLATELDLRMHKLGLT